jgi:hypothetical protein
MDLTANVQEVVLRLMHRMYCDPPQRAFASFWVVVDNCAIPVVGGQSGEDIAEHLCSVRELACHILRLLFGISIVRDPLVTSRRRAVRLIDATGASTRSRCTSSMSRRWHPYSSGDHTPGWRRDRKLMSRTRKIATTSAMHSRIFRSTAAD